jgi:hypothetical protein
MIAGNRKRFSIAVRAGRTNSARKKKQNRERDDDAGIKSEPERDRERIGNRESAQRADGRIDFAQWALHEVNERRSKAKADDHREEERDRHFHNRPTQVLEMFEERFRRFALGQVSKLKNIAQAHDSLFAEGDQAACEEASADRERVGVTNFVARDHVANFFGTEGATIQDRF